MIAPVEPHARPTGAMALETDGLTKVFGDFTPLESVNMRV